MMQKSLKITETLTYRYSSESTQRKLSYEYQHDMVPIVFINICILVHWTKVVLPLEGLSQARKKDDAADERCCGDLRGAAPKG